MIGPLIAAGASLIGGMLANKANKKAAAREYEQQKEFAQSGIQWKVQDAEKAGIHPLYALGANTTSYAPQSVGGSDFSFLADAGQNIGRAIDSTRSNPEKANALALTASKIQLEGLQLDNDIKRAQLASAMALARQGSAPGLPTMSTMPGLLGMPGQGDAPQIEGPNVQLQKKIAPTNYGDPSFEIGAAPETAIYKSKHGYVPQIPQALSEPFEQDWVSYYQWLWRNKINPPEPSNLPGLGPTFEWMYHHPSGEWRPARKHKTYRRWGPFEIRND